MKPRTRNRPRPPSGGARPNYSFECLSRLARILVRSGYSPRDLLSDVREICSTLKEPAERYDPSRFGFLADVPHVIALWHSDPAYLDSQGEPMALPLQGSVSLSALIERVMPEEDPVAVTRALLRMRGVRRKGTRFLPTGRHLSYRREIGRIYSLNALLRMLQTVDRNVAGARRAAIFERSAINPNFPVNALPAFHQRVDSRASDLLLDMDGYMRRREVGVDRGLRTRVGIEIFAFEEPARTIRKRRSTTAAWQPTAGARRARRRGR